MDAPEIFQLLDDIARGLVREAALNEEERAAKREQILAWFQPRYARLLEVSRARPCPIPWRLVIELDGTPPPPAAEAEPHPCPDCFNALYEAWKASRQRASILSSPADPAKERT